jgi:signal transduction histidine kinase
MLKMGDYPNQVLTDYCGFKVDGNPQINNEIQSRIFSYTLNRNIKMLHILSVLGSISDKPTDDAQEMIRSRILIFGGVVMSCGGLLWGSIALYFNLYFAAMIPYGYVLLTVINFSFLAYYRNRKIARLVQIYFSLLLPFLFQWILGGFMSSGAVMMWSLFALIISFITLKNIRTTVVVYIIGTLLIIFSAYIDDNLSVPSILQKNQVQSLFFAVNFIAMGSGVFFLIGYLVRSKDALVVEVADKTIESNEQRDELTAVLLSSIQEKEQQAELVIANAEKDKRVAELVIATAAKDQFLASMSHELRTPLNAIIGLSKALVSDTTMIRSSQETEYIVAIHSSGQHLLSLIGDVLDLSKLNAGARSLEKEPFTILELMEECRNTFLVTCQDKGVSLNIDSQFDGAYPVLGDITVLKQILYNLLSNAVKFTQQGSISITAEPYVAEEIDPNPNLGIKFIVADTGKGVSADAIGTLFDSFTQEDSGITRSFGGSGLGLNIAQKLAQLMGGEISCNSIVGQGSIFEVIVYLEQQPISSEMFDHSVSLEVPPLKLLIVDDVPLNLMVAAALLKPKGHIIETAANGHKALEMASNNDYDAILMDVHMPGMDGMEATRGIRNCANKQRAAVPIVALTADVDVRQKALFIASGMDTTVGKPWELKVLEKELKRLLKLG